MKSKSFNLNKKTLEKERQNKTFDFTGYYKTSEETNKALEITNNAEGVNKENRCISKSKIYSPNSQNSAKKKGKVELLNISRIDIDGPSLDTSVAKSTLNESKITSTPQTLNKSEKNNKVKSIMKTSSIQSEDYMDESHTYTPRKSKKRNKSVSFMLDTEELLVKKTKSNVSVTPNSENTANIDISKNKQKKSKKKKEKQDSDHVTLSTTKGTKTKISNNIHKTEVEFNNINVLNTGDNDNFDKQERQHKKRKFKKAKNQIADDNSEAKTEIGTKEEQTQDMIGKRNNKTKNTEAEADGEPSSKSRKKEVKPEVIVENLENLSIGDNAHTITNLLDEMVVAEKDKRKKHKRKLNKNKKPLLIGPSNENNEPIVENESAKEKAKVKWQRRKWNKDKKEIIINLDSAVIVDNLPISIICTYKKLLAEHFSKYGIIQKIGIAEVYPTAQSKSVFTTTIIFYSDGAAAQALQEDDSMFEGSRIRVRKALPPTQTTLVVRSYAELTEQALSSMFLPAGRIRNIRQAVKGKKTIGTAFIDFDSPETLEKAMQLAQHAKIAGKKVYVLRFELREKKAKKINETASANTANESDSEEATE